jgi:hypothetical protein
MGWEDEQRDDKGQWTAGGGAGPQQHANASADARAVHEAMKADTLPPKWGTNGAANVREAARLVGQQGQPVEIYRNAKSNYVAAYANGKVNLNASKSYWKDPVGNAKRLHEKGIMSSPSPEHVIHHEIGHALYDAPDNFMSNHEREAIGKHVSTYARMNPKEFVSEVHAGMKAGKQYPEHIMRLFHNYARPRTSR